MLKWFKRTQTPFQNDYKIFRDYIEQPNSGSDYIWTVPEGLYLELLTVSWLYSIVPYTGSSRYHFLQLIRGSIPFYYNPGYGSTPYYWSPRIMFSKSRNLQAAASNLEHIHVTPLAEGLFLYPHDKIRAYALNTQPTDEIQEFYLTAKAWRVI